MGKYVGGFVSICYIVLFLQITSWVTRNISDFMHVTLMPRTPKTVFRIVALVTLCTQKLFTIIVRSASEPLPSVGNGIIGYNPTDT
ncbi:GerAB/ArcD/ProY family transporter [Paenibacillus andongensis]|uniref:GerAB/ArcD/ProY family transporter n=1 Tax=Paenibacillus andongensis TaxID=2975482 RepID=UPI0021BBA696|nr:GerAB/ArcD/ProY family transporter [Paenibacillus andongensis]